MVRLRPCRVGPALIHTYPARLVGGPAIGWGGGTESQGESKAARRFRSHRVAGIVIAGFPDPTVRCCCAADDSSSAGGSRGLFDVSWPGRARADACRSRGPRRRHVHGMSCRGAAATVGGSRDSRSSGRAAGHSAHARGTRGLQRVPRSRRARADACRPRGSRQRHVHGVSHGRRVFGRGRSGDAGARTACGGWSSPEP